MKINTIHVELVKGVEGLAGIREVWHHVYHGLSQQRYYHLYEWYESYMIALAEDPAEVHFFCMYDIDKPVAIVPLRSSTIVISGTTLRTLELPHHEHILLADIICSHAMVNYDLLSILVDYLRVANTIKWDLLLFRGLLEDSAGVRLFNNHNGLVFVRSQYHCDYFNCTNVDANLGALSKNFKANLRKARNKLAQEGTVEFICARSDDELAQAFDAFLEVESSGWKGSSGTNSAIKLSPQIWLFYYRLASSFSKLGSCEINLLRVNGECVAGQFCLTVGDTYYILKIGYLEEQARLAPGNMLLEHVMKRMAASNEIRYLNLITDAEWHKSWNPERYKIYDCYRFNSTAKGLWAYSLISLKQYARPYSTMARKQLVTYYSSIKASMLSLLETPV